MRILGLSVVVALGLVVGLWWTRDAPHQVPTKPQSQSSRLAPIGPSAAQPRLVHERPTLVHVNERWTLEPTQTIPELRKLQEELWQELRAFATEAKLTDVQWERFQRDLSELAAIESAALATALKTGDDDSWIDLGHELADELETRCAAYMTARQLAELRFRSPLAMVTRVRQLYYIPKLYPDP